jgi:hypothetical protein
MPQLSSTDRLRMAANDMATALKHPHPEVPFSQVGDDTITALTQLSASFKNKSTITYSGPSQGPRKQTTSSIGTENFNFSHVA